MPGLFRLRTPAFTTPILRDESFTSPSALERASSLDTPLETVSRRSRVPRTRPVSHSKWFVSPRRSISNKNPRANKRSPSRHRGSISGVDRARGKVSRSGLGRSSPSCGDTTARSRRSPRSSFHSPPLPKGHHRMSRRALMEGSKTARGSQSFHEWRSDSEESDHESRSPLGAHAPINEAWEGDRDSDSSEVRAIAASASGSAKSAATTSMQQISNLSNLSNLSAKTISETFLPPPTQPSVDTASSSRPQSTSDPVSNQDPSPQRSVAAKELRLPSALALIGTGAAGAVVGAGARMTHDPVYYAHRVKAPVTIQAKEDMSRPLRKVITLQIGISLIGLCSLGLWLYFVIKYSNGSSIEKRAPVFEGGEFLRFGIQISTSALLLWYGWLPFEIHCRCRDARRRRPGRHRR